MTLEQLQTLNRQIEFLEFFEKALRGIQEQPISEIRFKVTPTLEFTDDFISIGKEDVLMDDAHSREIAQEIDLFFGWIRGEAGRVLGEIKKIKQKRLDEFVAAEGAEINRRNEVILRLQNELTELRANQF